MTGAPVLTGALASLDCRVEEIVERHTHAIVIGVATGDQAFCTGEAGSRRWIECSAPRRADALLIRSKINESVNRAGNDVAAKRIIGTTKRLIRKRRPIRRSICAAGRNDKL
jgi:hypothetical protein